MATASQRMAREKDDARYEALAKAFDEMRVERDAASRRVDELSARPNAIEADVNPEQKVEKLMELLDELTTVASDEDARQQIRPLVLRLGIWIGLDFEAGKFGKREVRRLRRGVIAFGQDHLPVRIHGVRHVSADGCPASHAVTAAVGLPAGSPVGSHRRRARHGAPTTITACHSTRHTTIKAPRRVAGARRSNPVPKEAMAPGTSARTSPTPGWSSLVPEVMSGRHDSNVRPLRPERSALARLSYAPMGATNELPEIPVSHMGEN